MALFRSIGDDVKRNMISGSMMTKVIIINLALFVVVNLVRIVLFLINPDLVELRFEIFIRYLAVPFDYHVLLYRPWTIITSMFFQYSASHIFWNMVVLYWFGSIWMEFSGQKRLLALYIYGGLFGLIMSYVSFFVFPKLYPAGNESIMLGASAAVNAIVVATAVIAPNYRTKFFFVGLVQIKYLAAIFIFLDIVSISYWDNVGGHFAHLGGAAFGYSFASLLLRGTDLSIGFNHFTYWFTGLLGKRQRNKPRIVYSRVTANEHEEKIIAAKRDKKAMQQKLDIILDKISRSGYDSLSNEEKEFLFKASKED